ncbi:aspartate aminotransferase family protein [Lacipirellula limnantheis]|uniref:alanine--glyoxylate transaminase n=1 Tax=Lacipirellula limnantheis TaxID=2528024 RepID=A0A517TWE4_9BACT|nr:aspartate aminotransferase family protein [Lacipirellula limnantheis]QDT72699.1 Diaminobutyrate--2-oxoglutarate aminotransferase [Lacipirellula limnantheis]
MPTETRASLPIIDHRPAAYDGPSKSEVLAVRQQYLTPGLITYYRDPLLLVEGHMQYLWDETGKRYLDAFAGIVTVSVGHCHPAIVKKVQEQVGKLQHVTTIYLHPTIGEFGKKLAEHFPKGSGLTQTYFTNSGSEANEIAILSAREFTGNQEVISLRNCYHGGTQATMALTAHSTWKFKTNPTINVKNALAPYCYRCPYGLEYPSCGLKCAKDVENVIKYETSGQVAAFIAESIQGVGGAVTPPPGYFEIVYDIVRKAGGLCIADEVQSGFGRTGDRFWGFENYGVTPDMVTMAKGIGNGAPLGACTTRPEIAAMMKNRIHFNTYGGNPISMTQGLATLEVIHNENIQQNAKTIGDHLKHRLLELQERHPLIGDVRGMGLMIGVELVRDRKSKEPANTEAADVMEKAKERGLIIGKGGLFGNTLRIKPPMCLNKDDADFLVDTLDEVLLELKR